MCACAKSTLTATSVRVPHTLLLYGKKADDDTHALEDVHAFNTYYSHRVGETASVLLIVLLFANSVRMHHVYINPMY